MMSVVENEELNSIKKTITVAAPQKTAFAVFTEKMTAWWPLSTHHIAKVEATEAVLEPKVGGRWYERGTDGSECEWGHVIAWDPPGRLILAWQISGDWQFDPKLITEVEVRFIAEGANRTRVELEHRNLDRFGALRDQVRASISSEGGWSGILALFAKAVQS
jgi:uncharacterized protein YndB with AHSA1/START domain